MILKLDINGMNTVISVATKNILLGAIAIDKIAIHSGEPGANGVDNELSSPRQDCVFSAPSNGAISLVNNVQFTVTAGSTVKYISYWEGTTFHLSQQIDDLVYSVTGTFTLLRADTRVSL